MRDCAANFKVQLKMALTESLRTEKVLRLGECMFVSYGFTETSPKK